MSLAAHVRSEFVASWRSFLRRWTAVSLTFFFLVITVIILGTPVQIQPAGDGLSAEPKKHYITGYLTVVVFFTPLSWVDNTVVRHHDRSRFEELAMTPLLRAEWLLAHLLVNAVVIGLAALLFLALSAPVTGTSTPLTPTTFVVVPFVAFGVTLFYGLGAVTGSAADSQDGVIAASNVIALPLLFLSETSVTPDLFPAWFAPALNLSSLMYFVRGVRVLTYGGGGWPTNLAVLVVPAVVLFAAGTVVISWAG